MTKFVWLALCGGLILINPALAGEYFEQPKFTGVVENIKVPVVMRYRPFPRSYMERTEEKKGRVAGVLKSVTASMIGYVSGENVGDEFVMIFQMHRLEGSEGARIVTKPIRQKGIIKLSKTGELRDIDVVGEDVTAKSRQLFIKTFGNSVQAFPEAGVETGDQFLTAATRKKLKARGMDISATVRGVTTFNDRPSLVVYYAGAFELDGRKSAKLHGFSVFDIETGIVLYSDVVTNVRSSLTKTFSGRAITRIELSM